MDIETTPGDSSSIADGPRHGSRGRRPQILRTLREGKALTVAQLASIMNVHPNTVRFHLRSLEHSGEVIREQSRAQTPGRPELRFRLTPEVTTAPERSDLLAHILLGHLGAAEDAQTEALTAGRRWGRAEALRNDPQRAEPVDGLLEMLEAAGFAPVRGADACLDLHNCPLREFLGTHGRLACSVHEGMMAGYLEGAHSTIVVDALEPFATDSTCRARLSHVDRRRSRPEHESAHERRSTITHVR